MHTAASTHACSTLHGYIAGAKHKGIKLFAITGHGPDMADAPHYWRFVNMHTWPRLVDEAGILRGIESNIKNIGGEIDCSGPTLTSLDLIIAGFHEPVLPPQDRGTHAQATIAAMANGKVHMVSYPGSSEFPVDIPAITEAVARYQAAPEINNSSLILLRTGSEDSCRAIAAAVRDAGGWVALGSGSHTTLTLGEFTEHRRVLDAVDFPEEGTLNASPCRLLNFLESRDMPAIPEFTDP